MQEELDYLVVTVSGQDRPGITAAFTRILVQHKAEIIDIDQASLQDFLGLSFLLDLRGIDRAKDTLLKDLLFEAHHQHMSLNFQLLTERELRGKKGKSLYVLTVFGGTRELSEIAAVLGEEQANIEKISNLRGNSASCIELTIDVRDVPALWRFKERLMAASHEMQVDLALQRLEVYRKSKRLVFFDMDQTLLDMEVVDEMARAAGVHAEVARVTEKAMRGEMDFEDSLRQRVALMKGLPLSRLEEVRDNLRLSEGAPEIVGTLRSLGYHLGVVSGGFRFFADHLKEMLELDFAYANEFEVKEGTLTGRLEGEVIDDAAKAKIVNRVAGEMRVPLDQTVAIGDGANDRLMLGQAGLGIAYNAKAALSRVASVNLGRSRLLHILYILGITEEDMPGL